PVPSVFLGTGERSITDVAGDVLGGVRTVHHNVFLNPLPSVSVAVAGNGVLSVSDGVGATSEVLALYGAFANGVTPGATSGPHLNLDVRPYDSFELVFRGVQLAMNINVTLYTANPLDPDNPLYYSTMGVNAAPATPGGAITVILPFAATPGFNFGDVDGISLVLNRAIGPLTGNGYTLDSFSLVTAVPEPGSAVLMLGGALLLASRLRRRAAA
ncbi:MAG: PEP-CTERM sorting domain-containing protein, partial [Betaproteobacteria bacterium]